MCSASRGFWAEWKLRKMFFCRPCLKFAKELLLLWDANCYDFPHFLWLFTGNDRVHQTSNCLITTSKGKLQLGLFCNLVCLSLCLFGCLSRLVHDGHILVCRNIMDHSRHMRMCENVHRPGWSMLCWILVYRKSTDHSKHM